MVARKDREIEALDYARKGHERRLPRPDNPRILAAIPIVLTLIVLLPIAITLIIACILLLTG
ncbi:MAG: hypothetical protein ACE5EQ_11930 [Phycisphaerae bacterium]